MSYKLIALDMDGTLLNSEKQISQKNISVVNKAIAAGKVVVLNTGRCLRELNEYIEKFDGIRYINCINGACVYDLKLKEYIHSVLLPAAYVKEIMSIAACENTMINLIGDKSVIEKDRFENINSYKMGIYKDLYAKTTEKCDDIYNYYCENPFDVRKINIFHTSAQSREKTMKRISEVGIDIEAIYAEETSLEITAKGVNKGEGLQKLCEYLHVGLRETIVVGDSYNDLGAFAVAGLSIAMENAEDTIKTIADVVVADCDNNGCAEAIERYLLESEGENQNEFT